MISDPDNCVVVDCPSPPDVWYVVRDSDYFLIVASCSYHEGAVKEQFRAMDKVTREDAVVEHVLRT